MDKFIIFTMGIKEINEAVQRVLFEKGYKWYAGSRNIDHLQSLSICLNLFENNLMTACQTQNDIGGVLSEHTPEELTFRELMELPPVHDEEEELAERIQGTIEAYLEGRGKTIEDVNLCKIRQKVEEKLGL